MKDVIYSINGPVVTVKDTSTFGMAEMVYVGNAGLIGEVISVSEARTTIQVYENTTGLLVGEPVKGTGAPLSATLGPGIMENIFDGIERPLTDIAQKNGAFIATGVHVDSLDMARRWDVTVTVKPDSGYVLETLTVTDKNGNELTLKDKGDGKYTFTMPAGKVEVKATFMEDNSVLNFFYDVPNGAYFYEAVKWAVDKGITNGLSDTMFGPYESCTRAQIVTFLYRALGKKVESSANFTDVKSDAFYADAVNWAVASDVTNGTSATTFSPNADCTRAEIVTFLYRAYQGK